MWFIRDAAFSMPNVVLNELWQFFVFTASTDKALITKVAFSPHYSSWIGQTITLTCETDGVPVPTITLTKPDGSQLKQETSSISTANLKLESSADFGQYKCSADNGFPSPDDVAINLVQISKCSAKMKQMEHIYILITIVVEESSGRRVSDNFWSNSFFMEMLQWYFCW